MPLLMQQIKESIQVCVMLNQWDHAVRLGHQYNIKEIDALLAKYASHLLGKSKTLDAIEVCRLSVLPFPRFLPPPPPPPPSLALHP